jgi:16S rRNA U1498 N3-methylase RsmE
MEQARAAGRSVVRFGRHVMRIETAAVAGAACLLSGTEPAKGDA